MAQCGIGIEERQMATLLKVDDSEIAIEPRDPYKGLEPKELFSLIGQTVRLVWLTPESVMVIKNDMTAAMKNYRATKVLQFFTSDPKDEVRGAALLVNRRELSLDDLTLVRWAETEIRIR